jgi:hypothetical protein
VEDGTRAALAGHERAAPLVAGAGDTAIGLVAKATLATEGICALHWYLGFGDDRRVAIDPTVP